MKARIVTIIITLGVVIGSISSPLYAEAATQGTNKNDNVLSWNKAIRAQYPTEGEALAYFLQPSDNLTYYNRGIQSNNQAIINQAQAITNGLATDYEKAKAIHVWVASNVWYDWDLWAKAQKDNDWAYVNDASTAAKVLNSKRTLCGGYTHLTVALLRAAGIPAKFVNGTYIKDDDAFNHAWYEAYVDGRWIIGDSTADRGGDYINSSFSQQRQGGVKSFDISIEEQSKSFKMFEGVLFTRNASASEVSVPVGVTALSDWTFLEWKNLKKVYLPGSVTEIGKHTFWNTSNLVIYGEAGSYAQTFAAQNGIKFVAGTM